jgi:acetyl esterase/lipase
MKPAFLFSMALYLIGQNGLAAIDNRSSGVSQEEPIPLLQTASATDNTEIWFQQGDKAMVRNVNHPTLTAFIPAPGTASGAAILIAPGGGFLMLSIETEGWDVARWFADRGVTAFVVKYRLNKSDQDTKGFTAQLGKMFVEASRTSLTIPSDAQADVVQAFKFIRKNASTWNLDVQRIGMLGFSAGAIVSMSGAQEISKQGGAPAFLGYLYGPLIEGAAPNKLPDNFPPIFIGLAADDPLFSRKGFALVNIWNAQKHPIEFHLYQKGGHGFGLGQKSLTNAMWPDEFLAWMKMNHWLESNHGVKTQ